MRFFPEGGAGAHDALYVPRPGKAGWLKTVGWLICVAVVIALLTKLKQDEEVKAREMTRVYHNGWANGTTDPELRAAIVEGDYDAIKSLLPEVPTSALQEDMLALLAVDRREAALRALIDSGWDPNGHAGNGKPLLNAVLMNQPAATAILVGNKARVDLRSPEGIPLLCLAAQRDSTQAGVLGILLQHGAKPNEPSSPVNDPLRIRRGEAVGVRHRLWPLEVASRANHPESVKLLLRHGADPRLFESECPSLIAVCAARSDKEGRYGDYTETIQVLLEHGVDVDGQALAVVTLEDLTRKAMKGTGLFFAAIKDDYPMAKLLLDHGADPRAQCERGQRPLDVAEGRTRQLLFDTSASPSAKGKRVQRQTSPPGSDFPRAHTA